MRFLVAYTDWRDVFAAHDGVIRPDPVTDIPGARAFPDDDALLAHAAAAEPADQPYVVLPGPDEDLPVRFLRRDPEGTPIGLDVRPATAEALDLLPHPEGGWFAETWRTGVRFSPPGYGGPRATATGIYFLLAPGEESRWHVVRSDEVWLHHAGGPLELLLGGTAGEPAEPRTSVLGTDLAAGHRPQLLVPAGTWQAARPSPTATEPTLVSCVVSPGFDFADFRAI
ncbi:MAG: cupin domain-containing protein [Streptosporangiales bacterium]|nr:cupin domain-containing protein [Streptosporangiales bacterium]